MCMGLQPEKENWLVCLFSLKETISIYLSQFLSFSINWRKRHLKKTSLFYIYVLTLWRDMKKKTHLFLRNTLHGHTRECNLRVIFCMFIRECYSQVILLYFFKNERYFRKYFIFRIEIGKKILYFVRLLNNILTSSLPAPNM